MAKLTLKQEKFCLAYIETGNASEAYRQVYSTARMKPETINVKASELLAHGKVSVRVEELRTELRERHQVTVDDLLNELEEARKMALEIAQPSSAVSATMGKAKLLGLDKQVVEHTGAGGGPIEHKDITDETLKQELERLGFGRAPDQLSAKLTDGPQ